jgi:hypothetical protein
MSLTAILKQRWTELKNAEVNQKKYELSKIDFIILVKKLLTKYNPLFSVEKSFENLKLYVKSFIENYQEKATFNGFSFEGLIFKMEFIVHSSFSDIDYIKEFNFNYGYYVTDFPVINTPKYFGYDCIISPLSISAAFFNSNSFGLCVTEKMTIFHVVHVKKDSGYADYIYSVKKRRREELNLIDYTINILVLSKLKLPEISDVIIIKI